MANSNKCFKVSITTSLIPLSRNFEQLDNYDDGRAISISEL